MKICDLCQKKVAALRSGPAELPPMEMCEDCAQDLFRRLSAIESRIVEIRQRMRAKVITEWQTERAPKANSAV